METPIADIWSLPNVREALTIFAMFCATYSTRLIGWLLLRNRTISPAFRRALEAAPGCVMAAIVAPQFMTTNPITITGLCTAVAVVTEFFPQFSFKFGVLLENNRSSKKQRLRIY